MGIEEDSIKNSNGNNVNVNVSYPGVSQRKLHNSHLSQNATYSSDVIFIR